MLGKTIKEWEDRTAIYTATETYQQPATWKKTLAQMAELKASLQTFLDRTLSKDNFDIVLTGAGTSEFVGNAVVSALRERYNFQVRSHGTTDIVASPEKFLSANRPTLLVSFARSGNSPESVGAVQAADYVCKNVQHLFITCNKDGALAKAAATRDNCFSIVLTEETNDKSFAMTSSFSNMYLAVYCALNLDKLDAITADMQAIIEAGQRCLDSSDYFDNMVAKFNYDRLVVLGTAELKGVAQESVLKSLELTAGQVAPNFDTPMGFRHGPKSIVNASTLTVVYLSDEPATRRYEMDLLKELSKDRKGSCLLAVMNQPDAEVAALCDYSYAMNTGKAMPAVLLGLDYVLVAQMIALFKSQALGITTDNPCPTGEVNRVVKGVTIYPMGE